MSRGVNTLLIGTALLLLGMAALLMLRESGPPATLDAATRAVSQPGGPSVAEWDRLVYEAERGNAVAMNNLGVAHWRQRGKSEQAKRAQARYWFEKAAANGDVAARYNLALTLPDKFDTAPEIIRKRLDLLKANVEADHVPSMVALARSLYFVNREEYVPDREETLRRLLARAAQSDDPDYLVIYGNTLWKQMRGGANPILLNDALSALKAAYEQGEPRGAERIGDILDHHAPDAREVIAAAATAHDLGFDPLPWYRRAADMGLVTAQCSFGFNVFRTRDWVRKPDLGLIERHFRAGPDILGNSPVLLSQAITDLESCAANPKHKRSPNLPFGKPSLHAYKLRGTWTSMSTQPGWANMTLGVIHGYGIGVPRDRSRALDYLVAATETHNFDLAAQIMEILPDF